MMRIWPIFALTWVAFGQSPEQRAVSYLEGEVRSWSRDNGCYSCHNDGDGARALYTAIAAGYSVEDESLAATTAWLQNPARWDANKGDPGVSDKALARIQWAAALIAAGAEGAALEHAADGIVQDQNLEGFWSGGSDRLVGSPVTWGRALSTAAAIDVLRAASAERYAAAIEAAEAWLSELEPHTVPDAAALVFAFNSREPAAKGRRFLRDSQASDDGWGPYRDAPSEVFDTALATLALKDLDQAQQGRRYLLRKQLSNGGWPETTRPPGSQSYAQHVSTTAWALMALIATDGERD